VHHSHPIDIVRVVVVVVVIVTDARDAKRDCFTLTSSTKNSNNVRLDDVGRHANARGFHA
jgi:hypothetical protein